MTKSFMIEGMIVSGRGEAKNFVSFAWVRNQIKEKIGFDPYQGTLNVKLSPSEARHYNKTLREANYIEISPLEGYGKGKLYRARIKEQECVIVVPELKEYPKNMVELIASTNLKKTLELVDGETICIEIMLTR